MHPTRPSYPALRPASQRLRLLIAFVISSLFASSELNAQDLSLIPLRKSPLPLARLDQSAQWNLILKKDVVIHSPLLRLRDVVEPGEQSSPMWERSGAAIIALMPVDEHEMIIDRTRLIEAVARSTTIPDIQWSGASAVRVTYRRDNASLEVRAQQTSVQAKPPATSPSPNSVIKVMPPMTPTERERVTKLIQYGVDRYDVKLRDAFEIVIDANQASIESLSDLRRVDTVSWEVAPSEGKHVAKVVGMNSREPVTAFVEVEFSARPLVVVAREGLRRGHVISEADLELIPAARNVSTDDVITDINDAIGFQVQTTLQKKRPVTRASIAPITVIERGDLVEVRVIGGGFTVATSAKSLAPGAHGDLIPIETLEPRRKLLARVVGSGQVEILTRPPRVR